VTGIEKGIQAMVRGDLQLAGSLLVQALELARRAGNREVEVARLYNLEWRGSTSPRSWSSPSSGAITSAARPISEAVRAGRAGG